MKPRSDIPRDERLYDGVGARKREYLALQDLAEGKSENFVPASRAFTSMSIRVKEARLLLDAALIAIKNNRRYVMHDLCMYHTNAVINARHQIHAFDRSYHDNSTDSVITINCIVKFDSLSDVMKFCAVGKFNLPVTTEENTTC